MEANVFHHLGITVRDLDLIARVAKEDIPWNQISLASLGASDKGLIRRVADSISPLTLAQRMQIGSTSLWFRLGRIMETWDDPHRAEIFYRTAVAHDPNNVEALWNLGALVYYLTNHPEEAYTYMERAYGIKPTAFDEEDRQLLASIAKKADKIVRF